MTAKKPTLLNGTVADAKLDNVLSNFWFDLGNCARGRLDERDRKDLVDHLERAGYRIAPIVATAEMREAGMPLVVGDTSPEASDNAAVVWRDMIEARPK